LAIIYDNSAGNTSNSASVSIASYALGYGSGNNRIVVVFGLSWARKQVDSEAVSCTFNSVAGTAITNVVSGASAVNCRTYGYYWLDSQLPASSGSYTVTFDTVKATDCGVVVCSFIGAAQQICDYNSSGTETDASYFSTSVTVSNADSFMVDGSIIHGAGNYTPDSPQTERYDVNPGYSCYMLSTKPNIGTGSQSMGWTADVQPFNEQTHIVTAWAPLAEANNPLFMFAGLT